MIGADPREEIRLQILSHQSRRMAVDNSILKSPQLCKGFFLSGANAGNIHKFPQAQNRGVLAKRQQILRLQPRAAVVKLRGRHAGGQHHIAVQRQPFDLLQQPAYPLFSGYIGELMGIGENRRGSKR